MKNTYVSLLQKEKKWSSSRSVPSFSPDTRTVTLPSFHGHTMQAAVVDIRYALSPWSFAELVRNANDELDESLHSTLFSNSSSRYENSGVL